MIREENKVNMIEKFLPKVHTSLGQYNSFKREVIETSLITELGMSQEESHRIADLTTRKIIQANIQELTAPKIRNWVCVTLGEEGYEEERKHYERVGMPVFEMKKLVENETIIKQFKELTGEGLMKEGNIGIIIYEAFKEYFALTDPYFNRIIWNIEKLLKKVKNYINKS